MPPQCWKFPGCPWDAGILSIEGLHSVGNSRDVAGIPGYLVLRDLYASPALRIPGMFLGSRDT
jgi:hypothetical protein